MVSGYTYYGSVVKQLPSDISHEGVGEIKKWSLSGNIFLIVRGSNRDQKRSPRTELPLYSSFEKGCDRGCSVNYGTV